MPLDKKKFPHIKLSSQSLRGNYFGAYVDSDIDSKQGYQVFISHTPGIENTCECNGYIHGKLCYHITEAKKLEQKLFVTFDLGTTLEKVDKKRERRE